MDETGEHIFGNLREPTELDREYVMELTTFGLQRLEKEPEYLSSEKKRLDGELEDVTVENLSIFLQATNTVNESQSLVHTMQSHVDDIIVTVPNLISSSQQFSNQSQALRNQRKANRQIVGNQMKVLEILELPQLMWKCARSKLYQQAFDLQSYAAELCQRHPDIAILRALLAQMEKTQNYILSELLLALEKPIQLPQCLKIIGFLSRMRVFSTDRLLLRQEFLSRRLKYVQSLLPQAPAVLGASDDEDDGHGTGEDGHRVTVVGGETNDAPTRRYSLSSNDAYDYLSKFMDLHRMHIFAIVTQYKAIFVDLDDDDDDDRGGDASSASSVHDLLVLWVHRRVIDLIGTVQALLPFVSAGAFLSSLAQTCDHCGQSLGHVGMDFRGLLPAIFEKRIVSLFDTQCNSAILQFESALTSHDWFVTVELLSTMGVKATDKNTDAIVVDDSSSSNNTPGSVPQILLQYPPLAVLTNGFIHAFNELREFVTYSVMDDCKKIVVHGVQATVNTIRKFSVSSQHYHHRGSHSTRTAAMRRSRRRRRRQFGVSTANTQSLRNKPQSVKDERRRSMANVATNIESDIQNGGNTQHDDDGGGGGSENKQRKENDENGDGDDDDGDDDDDEIDEVLANLVKVECEYLLPFLCDVFDLIFERRKEIRIDDLLEYFNGLYEIPQFTTVASDDDDDDDNDNGDDKKEEQNVDVQHVANKGSQLSLTQSDFSELETTIVQNQSI